LEKFLNLSESTGAFPKVKWQIFLGYRKIFLSQVENEKKQPSITTLENFAKHLKISKDILFIAGCDIPCELDEREKLIFSDIKNSALKILLLNNKQYA